MDGIDLKSLDVVVLAQLVGRVLDTEGQARIARRHPDSRPHHGYVFQHLVPGPMAVGQIADRMEVTQQAVSKTVAELERLGYVERQADPRDARVRLIALTRKGRAVIDDYRAIRSDLADELVAGLGERRVEQLRKLLAQALQTVGAAEAVAGRRVRPRPDESLGP